MGIDVIWTTPGRELHERLASEVDRWKGSSDSFAPVTVVSSSNRAGVSLRRILVNDLARLHGRQGLVNASFITPFRLVELLAAPFIADSDRRPVTTAVIGASIDEALRGIDGSGRFVRRHISSTAAIIPLYSELRGISESTFAALADSSERGAFLHRLITTTHELLADHHYDERDLIDFAQRRVQEDPGSVTATGLLVINGLVSINWATTELLRELGARTPSVLLAPLCDDEPSDVPIIESVSQLVSLAARPLVRTTRQWPVPELFSVSDPDAEVRGALARICERADDGRPFSSMGLVFTNAEPYAAIASSILSESGLRSNGPEREGLASSAAIRLFRALLDLEESGFYRPTLLDLLFGIPLFIDGVSVDVARWDVISIEAGVVSGVAEWLTKIGSWRERASSRVHGAERTTDDLSSGQLLRFIERAAGLLGELNALASASALVEWCRRVVDAFLVSGEHGIGPDHSQFLTLLDGLLLLDQVGGRRGSREFLDLMFLEADRQVTSNGSFGRGLFVGSIADADGLSFEYVEVVGLSERLYPRLAVENPLLREGDREMLGGAFHPLSNRLDLAKRQLLSLVLSAGEVSLSHPRGNLRSAEEYRICRFLMPGDGDEEDGRRGRRFLHVRERSAASYYDTLRRLEFPYSAAQFDLAEVVQGSSTLGESTPYARSVEILRGRAGVFPSKWDGLVALRSAHDPLVGRSIAPTDVERYVECPYSFLLSKVHRLEELRRPEESFEMTPSDFGTLVHRSLRSTFDQPHLRSWSAATPPDPQRVLAQASVALERELGEFVERGAPIRRAMVRHEAARARLFLERLIAATLSVETTPLQQVSLENEWRFDSVDPFEWISHDVDIPSVRFHGTIDQVLLVDGRPVRVLDFKTGAPLKRSPGASFDWDGRHFQLPIYALAALANLRGELPILSQYAYSKASPSDRLIGFAVDGDVLKVVLPRVLLLLESIHTGVVPRSYHSEAERFACPFCQPLGLGPEKSSRIRRAQSSVDTASLANLLRVSARSSAHGPTAQGGDDGL